MGVTFYRVLSDALTAQRNCEEEAARGPLACAEHFSELAHEWSGYIDYLMRNHAPSGSGFDNGTKFHPESSTHTKLVFVVDYHHMNEGGFYDGWTTHSVTVTPTFDSVHVRVSGRDRNQIKDFIADTFYSLASQDVPTFADWRKEQIAKRIGRAVAKGKSD